MGREARSRQNSKKWNNLKKLKQATLAHPWLQTATYSEHDYQYASFFYLEKQSWNFIFVVDLSKTAQEFTKIYNSSNDEKSLQKILSVDADPTTSLLKNQTVLR